MSFFAMPEFVSLSAYVQGSRPATFEPSQSEEIEDSPVSSRRQSETAHVLADVRRFHAALADALDATREKLLRELACSVLGRELMLAPAEIETITADAVARVVDEEPVRVRAHPDDVPRVASAALPVIADATLRRGDVMIDVRSGTIDASLGVRLASLLAACSSPLS
jgi:flagellar biosynthesis/type III secretory pathway protein FliH